jgi:hypothetical protein
MEEDCKRRILDLIDDRLRAERKVILEVLTGVIMKERKSVSGDFGEELRQLRLELGHFNAVMEDLTKCSGRTPTARLRRCQRRSTS